MLWSHAHHSPTIVCPSPPHPSPLPSPPPPPPLLQVKHPPPLMRPVSMGEESPDLQEPSFSNCTLPVVTFMNWVYVFVSAWGLGQTCALLVGA